jgi:hypothetical protein
MNECSQQLGTFITNRQEPGSKTTRRPCAPDVDNLHSRQLAVSVANEALGEHVVGARVCSVAVLGLSMAVVNTEDARPLRSRRNSRNGLLDCELATSSR